MDTAKDGEEGLYKATVWNYDAVLLDVMLPKIDGWKVLSDLRRTKKTPVLMLTARDAVADRVRGLNTGADDYLVKPFALKELTARLRALIRRSSGQADPLIRLGEVTVDTAARRVLRGGAFDSAAKYLRSTARFRYDSDVRYSANGFRVVRELQ